MPVFVDVRRCFFQVLKLLVFRRRVAVADGGGVIIHSLASDGSSGNILQLDSGGVGGGGPARRLTFVWQVIQLTLLAGSSTEVAEVFAGVLEFKKLEFVFKNR